MDNNNNNLIYLLIILITFYQIDCRHRHRKSSAMIDRHCLKCDSNETFTFFWRIERRFSGKEGAHKAPPSYFFGTIHAPYTKVWNYIPPGAKIAFRHTKNIIFELDLMNSETLLSLTKCQLLPPGIRLNDIIPIQLYHRLQRHLRYVRHKIPEWITNEQKSLGLNANSLFTAITMNWERKRPIWIMIMLNSLVENDIKSKGITVLDSYFYLKAKKLRKNIGSVENAKEQCKTLNYLNTTQVLYALNQTLSQHEFIRRRQSDANGGDSFKSINNDYTTTDNMINYYNCGNLNEKLFNNYENGNDFDTATSPTTISNEIEKYFRLEIILKRNKRMSKRIIDLLQSNKNESFFFIFGAGHFLGNDSIIELIKNNVNENDMKIVHLNDITGIGGNRKRRGNHNLICNEQKWYDHKDSESLKKLEQFKNIEEEGERIIYPISSDTINYLSSINWSPILSDKSHDLAMPASTLLAKNYNIHKLLSHMHNDGPNAAVVEQRRAMLMTTMMMMMLKQHWNMENLNRAPSATSGSIDINYDNGPSMFDDSLINDFNYSKTIAEKFTTPAKRLTIVNHQPQNQGILQSFELLERWQHHNNNKESENASRTNLHVSSFTLLLILICCGFSCTVGG